MTAFASITINDGQATPVAHTFNAQSLVNDVALWEDRVTGVPVGYPKVSAFIRRPTKTNRNYKVTFKLSRPVLNVTSPSTGSGIQPAPSKAYDCFCSIDFVLPEASSLESRKDILAYAKNFLALSMVTSYVQDFEGQF